MDCVVKAGDKYKFFLVNDDKFIGEILSVDENWIEVAKENELGSYDIEIYPKSMVKRLVHPNGVPHWIMNERKGNIYFTAHSFSDEELEFTKSKNPNLVILDSYEDAKEYALSLKKEDPNKEYKVQDQGNWNYDNIC